MEQTALEQTALEQTAVSVDFIPTAQWLSEVLRTRGHLTHGTVASVAAARFETAPSVLMRLEVTYTKDAPEDAPRRLILKVPKPHKAERFLREVRFYVRVAPVLNSVSLARCFAAFDGTITESPWLVLEDASQTHRAVSDEAVDASHLGQIAQALAGLHASLWGRSDLEDIVGATAEAAFAEDCAGNERRCAEMADIFGDRFPQHWRDIYERALDAAPLLLLARAGRGALTLCHPDAHLGNFLLPRLGSGGGVVIIDWHDYRAWIGVRDVAVLLLTDTGMRRSCERQVLQRYYVSLVAAGVENYAWADLWHDYRLSVLQNLFLPLGNRRQPWGWDQLERVTSAFEDLKCGELINE